MVPRRRRRLYDGCRQLRHCRILYTAAATMQPALYVRRIYVHTHNHRLLDARRCAIAVARPVPAVCLSFTSRGTAEATGRIELKETVAR